VSIYVGVDNYSFHRYFGEVYPGQDMPNCLMRLEDFTALMERMQVQCCSLETCFLHADEELIRRVAQRFPDGVMFAWGHPNGFMETSEAESRAQITRFLRLSREIGSEVLRVTGSSIKHFSEPHAPQVELTIKRLRGLLPLAQEYEVRLALENHGDFYINEILHILYKVDSPLIGVALDTGNSLRLKEDPEENVRKLADRVFVVHAKDLRFLPGAEPDDPLSLACVPAGQGITDFPAVFHTLTSVGFSGMVLVELSRLHPDVEKAGEAEVIRQSLDYLKSLKDEVGK